MKKLFKGLIIALCVALTVTGFTSCSKKAYIFEVKDAAGNILSRVTAKEYLFWAYQKRLQYESSLSTLSEINPDTGNTYDYDIVYDKYGLIWQIENQYAAVKYYESLGGSLDDENVTESAQYWLDYIMDNLGEAQFAKFKAIVGVTKNQMLQYLKSYVIMADLLYDKIYSEGGEQYLTDNAAREYFETNFYRYKMVYILKYTEDEFGDFEMLEGDELKKAEDKANEAYSKAGKPGVDFDKLIKDYSDSDYTKDSPDGFVDSTVGARLSGEKEKIESSEKIEALKPGEVLLLTGDDGWRVIQKCELNPKDKTDFYKDYLETPTDGIRAVYEVSSYNDLLETKKDLYKFEENTKLIERYFVSKLRKLNMQ